MSQQDLHPSPDEISALAKLFWEEEGRPEGRAMEHWCLAENESRRRAVERLAAATASPNPPVIQGLS